jgi:hypothetical protein
MSTINRTSCLKQNHVHLVRLPDGHDFKVLEVGALSDPVSATWKFKGIVGEALDILTPTPA